MPSPLPAIACCVALAAWELTGCGGTRAPCDGGGGDAPNDVTGDDAPGALQITTTVGETACPTVNPFGVGPDNGGMIALDATLSGDAPDGETIMVDWSATAGTFSDPHSLDTTYFCAAAGIVTVTLTASLPGCQQQASAALTCDVLGPIPP